MTKPETGNCWWCRRLTWLQAFGRVGGAMQKLCSLDCLGDWLSVEDDR